MLSRDCDGCSMQHMCSERYRLVSKGEKVYCPDGTAHLVDHNNIYPSKNCKKILSAKLSV